jgi:hypothetical protein
MIARTDCRCSEVFVPHHRAAKGNVRLVFLTVAAFLISGSMTASVNPSTQQEHLTSPQPVGIAIDILSPVPAGVSFVPYLSNLSAAIKRSLSAKLPESVANGKKGIVVIRLRVQKDGSFSDDAVAITTSSGKRIWMMQALPRFVRLRRLGLSLQDTWALVLT